MIKLGVNCNGFVFDVLGQLVSSPDIITVQLLDDTYSKLISRGEMICASRINRLINIETNYGTL